MKRISNTWQVVVDEDNAMSAIIDGTRFKRGKRGVQKLLFSKEVVAENPGLYHQIDPEKARIYAKQLTTALKNKTWHHSAPIGRMQYCANRTHGKGKWRNLYIPRLDDHIVGHMLIKANMRAFTRGMHPFCCGSVPGRGVEFMRKTIAGWMKNDRQMRYFVKLDIRHFFDNIDKDKLLYRLNTKIKDKDSMWGFSEVTGSAPVACPVGYYTSPWFANLYLEPLDWFIEQLLYKKRRGKRIKYVRHFIRYIDDMVLFGTSKADLEKAVRAIIDYLRTNYGLEIKHNWEIKHIAQFDERHDIKHNTYWLDMGGYKFAPNETILRDGIFLSTRRMAKEMSRSGYYTAHQCLAIISKIGWAKHCNSRSFIECYIKPYINIKTVRRIIGYVAKVEELRRCASA